MAERINTVIIGGGQSGLAISHELALLSREHVVLEASQQLANPWRTARWDSFMMNTPNFFTALPGKPYEGPDPDGFSSLATFIRYLEEYAASFNPPIRFGVRVTAVDPPDEGGWFPISIDGGPEFLARNVVVAAGVNQSPSTPTLSASLSKRVRQLHSSAYRNPAALPAGAVLVVGGGDSGCQIAEELNEAGRTVYVCVSRAARRPRRYRGRDQLFWTGRAGLAGNPFIGERRPTPQPQQSGARGGHTINLHQFANDGVFLLGHLLAVEGERTALAMNVAECLAEADASSANWKQRVDEYIARERIEAPPAEPDPLDQARSTAGERAPERLDLNSAGINTVIWATGYRYDFSWIHLPVFNQWLYPQQDQGVTTVPGLYFVGVQSGVPGNLRSVSEAATSVAAAIAQRD